MEAKLIRKDNDYFLEVESWYPKYIRPAIIANTFVKPKGEVFNLSKQNCDEIFGVVDVEKFAKECSIDWEGEVMEHCCGIYKEGFNKAMELNKDKLFTIKEVVELCKILLSNPFEKCGKTYQELTDNYIQSIQQPKEIEVEIEMNIYHSGDFVNDGNTHIISTTSAPKIDENGYLILKRL